MRSAVARAWPPVGRPFHWFDRAVFRRHCGGGPIHALVPPLETGEGWPGRRDWTAVHYPLAERPTVPPVAGAPGGQYGSKGGGGKSNAAAFQQRMEFVNRAVDSHSGGVLIAAHGFAHGAIFHLLEKSEQNGLAIIGIQLVDRFIQ
jgi:hypothetical protein